MIFPLTFIANTFVPTKSCPPVLKAIADWNPISALVQAARELFGNIAPNAPAPTSWPLVHAVPYLLTWVVGILVVFVPLAVPVQAAAAR